jgi:crossover junction endodeoxyribonuclease RuvC
MTVLAIDPGFSGALAWVSDDGHLIEVLDMPVAKINKRTRIVPALLADLMALRPVDFVVIEQVGPHRGEGSAGAFSFGYGAGLLEGVATAQGIPVHFYSPATWKRRAGVPGDKGAARAMACRYWPGASQKFARVRDDGRAESALLGRWAALLRPMHSEGVG